MIAFVVFGFLAHNLTWVSYTYFGVYFCLIVAQFLREYLVRWTFFGYDVDLQFVSKRVCII
jgi:hypothetical protein